MSHKLRAFMVARGLRHHRKMRRLTDAEFICFVHGILELAAESPERGRLLLAEGEPATPEDIAAAARVTVTVARSTIRKLRRMRTLAADEHVGDLVRNWQTWNPEPRPSETPPAWRERKQRQRQRDTGRGDAGVYKPAAWAVTMRDEHFPGLPTTALEGAAATLRWRRQEPSVEAIRDLIGSPEPGVQFPLGENGSGIRSAS